MFFHNSMYKVFRNINDQKKQNETKHNLNTLKAVSTKVYTLGEKLDNTAVSLNESCDCGYAKEFASSATVTFNETNASANSKGAVSYNGKTYEFPIPVDGLRLEAENCNISDNTSNYQVDYVHYSSESKTGADGTDTISLKSSNGDLSEVQNMNYSDSTMNIKIYSDTNRKVSLNMKAASCLNGNNAFDMEDYFDLTVNGEEASFAQDATFKSTSIKWFGWQDVHIVDVDLKAGENIITIKVNYAGKSQKSGQGPCNIDYFTFDYI